MSPLTKSPYIFHEYPNSANRNIRKALKAMKILTFYQQRRTPWYHVCEKQQRANSGQGWHFCHAQWTSNGYSYFRSSFTTSAFLYLKLPNICWSRCLMLTTNPFCCSKTATVLLPCFDTTTFLQNLALKWRRYHVFSLQNYACLREPNVVLWEKLALVVCLVLESKAFY